VNHYICIKDLIKKEDCCFVYGQVSVGEVEKLLLTINNDEPPGTDNFDGKL
jgi:hypothetical protein